jgi:thiamine pyrophosphokinase
MADPDPLAAGAARRQADPIRHDRVIDRARVVVFVGGDPLSAEAAARLEPGAFVVAADSGVEQAQAHGWPIDVAVGDFDSVDPAALARAQAAGARLERHPAVKDATDLELALGVAAATGPDEIVVAGGAGGRLDHLLGGLLALTDEAYAHIRVSAHVGPARVFVVRDHLDIPAQMGELVTLLPVGGPAGGITTHGLRYPLLGETLWPASTRGVSNEVLDDHVSIDVADGVLLAIFPGPESPTSAPAGAPEPVAPATSPPAQP